MKLLLAVRYEGILCCYCFFDDDMMYDASLLFYQYSTNVNFINHMGNIIVVMYNAGQIIVGEETKPTDRDGDDNN